MPVEVWTIVVLTILAFLIAGLVIRILYLRTLYLTLKSCHPLNRAMEPRLVWLNVIPVFHIIWEIPTVDRVSTTLRREFAARGLDRDGGSYGRSAGLLYCSLVAFSHLTNAATLWKLGPTGDWAFAAGQTLLTSALLAAFIVYWVSIAQYRRTILEDDHRPRAAAPRPDPTRVPMAKRARPKPITDDDRPMEDYL